MHISKKWIATWALCLAACTAQTTEEAPEVGRLDVPLVSSGSAGTQFALAGTFTLNGPESIMSSVGTGDADFFGQDVLTLNPRVGTYDLTLSGWTIYRVSGNPPTGMPVTGAVLNSAAMQQVEINNNQTTHVVYQFNVPGEGTVVFARGQLNIDFAVGEGYPDGAACSQGSECANLVCTGGVCTPATCNDGVQNGMETSPDCGPGCPCDGMGGTECNAAQVTLCSATDICSVDAAGVVICTSTEPLSCTAAQQAACPAGDTCSVDAAGNAVCSSGTMACTAAQVATCPADGNCLIVGGMVTCGGTPLDPAAVSCVKINEISANGLGTGTSAEEYVEIYNSCAVTVSIAGARLFYRSAAGTTNVTMVNFPATAVMAGGSYLVYGGSAWTGASDGTLVNAMSALGGGLQLNHTGTVIDTVGYGSATNAFIEGMPAAAPANGMSISRTPNGSDSGDNAVDFAGADRTPGTSN